jgi:hypothetical protein
MLVERIASHDRSEQKAGFENEILSSEKFSSDRENSAAER